jgi:hypothetical protein
MYKLLEQMFFVFMYQVICICFLFFLITHQLQNQLQCDILFELNNMYRCCHTNPRGYL